MKILYGDVDIYPKISVNTCFYDCYAGGHADELTLRFNDTRKEWDRWAPRVGENLQAELSCLTTGKMYITAIKPEPGYFTLKASSIPESMRMLRSKSWEEVKFHQLLQEIADRNGLALELFHVDEQQYAYVEQSSKDDLTFLLERCALESCSFLVFDGSLVVYSEPVMESNDPEDTITLDGADSYHFRNKSRDVFGACVCVNGTAMGMYAAGDGPVLRKVIPIAMSDQNEANRFAKGLLRFKNKAARTIEIQTASLLKGYAAGSVIGLESNNAASWDGPAFIERIRFDMLHETSKLFLRKPLEGY